MPIPNTQIIWHVPSQRNPFFTGREDVLALPPDLLLLRSACYGGRNAHPRTADYTPLFTDQLLIELVSLIFPLSY